MSGTAVASPVRVTPIMARNLKQMKIAERFARRRGIELLDAVLLIAGAFAAKYPPLG